MTLTAKQMIPAVGAKVIYPVNGLEIECVVTDAKSSFGNARVEIKPVAGNGKTWVNLASVKLATNASVKLYKIS